MLMNPYELEQDATRRLKKRHIPRAEAGGDELRRHHFSSARFKRTDSLKIKIADFHHHVTKTACQRSFQVRFVHRVGKQM